jgi:hypothetical protein
MPKKIKEPVQDITLDFTGKATLVVELVGYGPMEFRIDSKDTLMKIVRVLLEEMNNTTTVDSYDKRTQNTLNKLLDF